MPRNPTAMGALFFIMFGIGVILGSCSELKASGQANKKNQTSYP